MGIGLAVVGMFVGGCMPGKSFTGALPPVTPVQVSLAEEIKADVTFLAGTIGHRDTDHPENLSRAADYIEKELKKVGLVVVRHPYAVANQTVYNLDAEIKGETDEVMLVGAHYDSVKGAPGANDNASGIAAVLALARRMGKDRPRQTLRLAAFVNEEPPYFQTDRMGSLVYAKECQARGDKIAAMISVETIGCYSDEPGSQRYPSPFNLFYPKEGNFIAFVGNVESADLVKRIVGQFRKDVRFPSEGAAVLGSIEGVGWSDHWSFWKCGYKAIMVTDTAPFRYRWYHTAGDTPDKLDYERTARVVEGLEIVVRDLLK
ncbi:MAG: peptidase [Phycisphaerales bacterium]|nr:peptidase [Phycisphaerales bacterium]